MLDVNDGILSDQTVTKSMKAGVNTCNIVEIMKKPLQKKCIDNCKCNPNKPFRPSSSAF